MASKTPDRTICVMIGDVSYDYTLELMNGINDAAKREKVHLFYMTGKQNHGGPADPDKEHETASRYNSIYDYASLVGADACIISCGSLSGFESDAAYQQFLKRFEGTAYVVLQKEIMEGPLKSCITIDNYNSFCQCIEHLIADHGYQKIAFVSGPKDHPEAKERERAYRDTMKKHGLAVEEGMVVYGDLSGFVDAQVAKLLMDYPSLDAIAFCNDEMAKAGYRVCAKQGLRIGKDIAITGFDNFATGRTMTPPLTTISQNAYRTGELALMQAICLAEGKRAESVRLKTSLHIRSSCGCNPLGEAGIFDEKALDVQKHLCHIIDTIRADLFWMFAQDGQEHLKVMLESLMDHIASLALSSPSGHLDEQALDIWLTTFAGQLNSSGALIAERLHHYLLQISNNPEHPGMKNLCRILLYVQGFLFSHETREAANRFENFRSQAWFVPEFIRDLVVLEDEDEGVFRNVVGKLRSIGLDNLYICLLPEPQILRESKPNDIPDRLLLAAYLSGSISRAYPRSRMPAIDKERTLRTLPHLNRGAPLISFSIFSGDVQYGILLCEANKEKIPLLHVIGLQLGILINFLDLKGKERIVGKELELIRERIEILNFLSEYDALCNIYNRRGFIERAIHMNRENIGRHAFCAFMDLDHLKEINDTFGHAAGDEAICAVSGILQKVVRTNDLIARLGGDEFVGMFITDNPEFEVMFRSRLKEAFEDYNRTCGKPYYVEASMGIAAFTCSQGLEISKIISEADRYLYEEKKNKRASALK